ncbi:hypothetical protein LIER_23782 [Lithospermum erythrorhizon]|uniref:C2 domain-containing protein n=1 Tax=Lithospermum erythrorhizon TaxID=34254 RepID=A0AAV3R120_LITER
MAKIWVEVCLVSARGLRRTTSFWKLQWFAVGWIDPANKFCSSIDSSGNDNPLWRTKFSAMIDTCERSFEELVLHVEVHSREPIFLRTKLLGTVSVLLKEFVDKYMKDSEVVRPIEEVGSFQLRSHNSNKPQGFIDISIRIAPEREEGKYHLKECDHVGFNIDSRVGITLPNQYRHRQTYQPQRPGTPFERHEDHSETSSHYSNTASYSSRNSHSSITESTYGPPSRPYSTDGIKLHNQYGHCQSYPSQPRITLSHRPESHSQTSKQYGNAEPYSSGSHSSSIAESTYGPPSGLHNQPPISLPIPPPPPPPTNVGYIPTFLPRTEHVPPSYMSMRSSGAAHGRETGHSLGMGLGAGTLAAGAVIFGDDFLSGFDLPSGLPDDNSEKISIDPPF